MNNSVKNGPASGAFYIVSPDLARSSYAIAEDGRGGRTTGSGHGTTDVTFGSKTVR